MGLRRVNSLPRGRESVIVRAVFARAGSGHGAVGVEALPHTDVPDLRLLTMSVRMRPIRRRLPAWAGYFS
jgi:hypothetical protein